MDAGTTVCASPATKSEAQMRFTACLWQCWSGVKVLCWYNARLGLRFQSDKKHLLRPFIVSTNLRQWISGCSRWQTWQGHCYIVINLNIFLWQDAYNKVYCSVTNILVFWDAMPFLSQADPFAALEQKHTPTCMKLKLQITSKLWCATVSDTNWNRPGSWYEYKINLEHHRTFSLPPQKTG